MRDNSPELAPEDEVADAKSSSPVGRVNKRARTGVTESKTTSTRSLAVLAVSESDEETEASTASDSDNPSGPAGKVGDIAMRSVLRLMIYGVARLCSESRLHEKLRRQQEVSLNRDWALSPPQMRTTKSVYSSTSQCISIRSIMRDATSCPRLINLRMLNGAIGSTIVTSIVDNHG